MEKSNLTPEESMQIIAGTIQDMKNKFQESGHMFIMWGVIMLIVIAAQHIISFLGYYDYTTTPNFLFVAGAVYHFYYIRKTIKKRSLPKTPIGDIFTVLGWMVGLNLLVLGFFFSKQLGESLVSIFIIFLGLLVASCGAALKIRLIMLCGFAMNLVAFSAFFIVSDFDGVIMAVAAIVGMIIPGVVLVKNKNRSNV